MNDYLEIRELYHHGIKGQKWGIRRYQNEDGSLTAEGKARYGTVENMKYERKRSAQAKGRAIGATVGAGLGFLGGVTAAGKPESFTDFVVALSVYPTLFAMGGAAIGAGLGHIGGKSVNKLETNSNDKRILKNSVDKLQKQLEEERKKQQNRRYPMDEKPDNKTPWDEKPSKPEGRI